MLSIFFLLNNCVRGEHDVKIKHSTVQRTQFDGSPYILYNTIIVNVQNDVDLQWWLWTTWTCKRWNLFLFACICSISSVYFSCSVFVETTEQPCWIKKNPEFNYVCVRTRHYFHFLTCTLLCFAVISVYVYIFYNLFFCWIRYICFRESMYCASVCICMPVAAGRDTRKIWSFVTPVFD